MPHLTDPLTFAGGARALNRAWLAPMTNMQSHPDGELSDDELRWIAMRSAGGFGVIETCAAHVARDGQGWPGELGIFDDRLLPGLTRLARRIADDGGLGIVQIFHGGVRAPSALTGQQPWSASPVEVPGAEKPREATEGDLERVIAEFRDAARRAHAAGFHGVELHGAHGYLFGQFLSATMNQRSDRWGGSIENRARLVREATRAVRSAVPASFVVGVRLSPEDRVTARGLDLDESIEVARWLSEDGADFIHLSLWDASKNTAKRPHEHPIPLFRAAVPPEVRIVACGNVWTRGDAEALLEKGADAVAIGRAAIANPEWARSATNATDPANASTWEPHRPPVRIADLLERGLNPTFASYMRGWKGFVAD